MAEAAIASRLTYRWVRAFPVPWGRRIECRQLLAATICVRIGSHEKKIVLELDQTIPAKEQDRIQGWLEGTMLRNEHIEDILSPKVLDKIAKHFGSLERIIITPSRRAGRNYLRPLRKALIVSAADLTEQIYRQAFNKTRTARRIIYAHQEQRSHAVAGAFYSNASVHDTVYMAEPMPIPGHELFARCLTRFCPIMVLPLEEKQEDQSSVMTLYLPGKGEKKEKVNISHIDNDPTFNNTLARMAPYIGHYHLELAMVTLMRRAGEFSDSELANLEENFRSDRTYINLGEHFYKNWREGGKKTLARFNADLVKNLQNFVPVLRQYIRSNSNRLHRSDLALLLLGAYVDKKIDRQSVMDYLCAKNQDDPKFEPIRDYLEKVEFYLRYEEKRFFSINCLLDALIELATN